MITNIQEREELEFVHEREDRMCLEEAASSVSMGNADARAEINAALAKGLFVVVFEHPAYCRATDAICGTWVDAHSTHATRSRAQAAIDSLTSSDFDPETNVYILPRADVQPSTGDEELPF